jgi:hypothetical protein
MGPTLAMFAYSPLDGNDGNSGPTARKLSVPQYFGIAHKIE